MTDRQSEIWYWHGRNATQEEIAQAMNISVSTVKREMAAIRRQIALDEECPLPEPAPQTGVTIERGGRVETLDDPTLRGAIQRLKGRWTKKHPDI